MQYAYGEFGPGGGSVPEYVMRTGTIAPFNPMKARHDIQVPWVERATRVPVGYPTGVATYSPPSIPPFPALPAQQGPQTVMPSAATKPAETRGYLLGSDGWGRPVRQFDVEGAPSTGEAQGAVAAMKRVAKFMKDKRLEAIAPPLVGGPLAALARGEAVVLRWTNGVAISAAL